MSLKTHGVNMYKNYTTELESKTYTKLHRVMTWSSGISLNFTYEVLSPCYFALYPGIGWPELSNAEAEICSLTHKLHRRLWTSNIYI